MNRLRLAWQYLFYCKKILKSQYFVFILLVPLKWLSSLSIMKLYLAYVFKMCLDYQGMAYFHENNAIYFLYTTKIVLLG